MADKLAQMNQLAEEISACERCMLHLTRNRSVPGEGNIDTKVLFIGEGPGKNENNSGRPFVGAAGMFLNELLRASGVDRKDVFITNVVKCRPPENRDPMPEELSACASFLDRQIALIDPLVIVTLGRFSMARYFPMQRISAIHGQGSWINGRMIVPMFHPAAALHQPALKQSILADFGKLPYYLDLAAKKLNDEDQSVDDMYAPSVPEPEDPPFEDGYVIASTKKNISAATDNAASGRTIVESGASYGNGGDSAPDEGAVQLSLF